ncbi:MAG TPA: DUF6636 domain-containing protein [Thermoleophilaceae bacterium]|nr:DUF6636 domain-containing protein [Thermoleophilaceae bacterium]
MRRLALLLILVPLVAGCGSGDETTTVTTTETGSEEVVPTDTGATDTGATETEPPPPEEAKGERIEVGDLLYFEMPSKRIGCAATTSPTTLRCDTAFPTRFSRSGRTCEFGDFGQAFMLRRSGRGRPICAGDTVLSATDPRTIPYGSTWLLGPYSCTSRKTGLTCRNPEGHGIALSLEEQRVF